MPRRCDKKYCIICLDVPDDLVAITARKIYHHPQFNTAAKRMGKVIRLLGAIHQVAFAKVAEEKNNLREALDKIRSFEDKYKLSFSDFERSMPLREDVQLHEDYVEYSF